MKSVGSPRTVPRSLPRKQQARSVVTRERILDAALDCLVERGYARTATADVADRAGVSRGAQAHHFPTRTGLFAATVEHLAERRFAELRETVTKLPPEENALRAAVDFIWKVCSEPSAYASLELVIAARTDDDLRAALQPAAARFAETLRRAESQLVPAAPDRERFNAFCNLVFVAMQGLAVMKILGDDESYRDGVLTLLEELWRGVLAPAPTSPSD